MSLRIVPITQREAFAFVKKHHRHHRNPRASVFQVAVAEEDKIVGVAIVNRPVARMLDNGWTLEVARCCTDGSRNACSMLYGAAWRAAKALGYKKVVTYTLPEEGGGRFEARDGSASVKPAAGAGTERTGHEWIRTRRK